MRAGMMIRDRYRLERRLGAGGQASVWLCRDLTIGREVAVKVVDFKEDPDRARRAEREVRALQRLTDPHTVRVLDTGRDDDDYVYIVMPVISGESLSSRLRRGGMGVTDMIPVIQGVSSSLGEAHSLGICHRDVKPGNIMIHASGAAVLLDFGIASSLDQSTALTATGAAIGTPSYMAPEVVSGGKATPASDVYALGAVMYECVCGRPPFVGDTFVAIAMAILKGEYPPPSCTEGLRDLIVQMLKPDPSQRPSAQDLLTRLTQIRTTMTSRAAGRETTAVLGDGIRDSQPTSATQHMTVPPTRPYNGKSPRSGNPQSRDNTTLEQTKNLLKTGSKRLETGRYKEALDTFRQALDLYRKIPGTQEDQAACLNNTGYALNEMGRYEEALVTFRQALDLYRKIPGTQEDQAACLNNTGYALGEMGRHEEALVTFRQALDLYQQVSGTQEDQAACLLNTGYALDEMGRYEEALDAYQQALDLYQQVSGTQKNQTHTQQNQARCLLNTGYALGEMGRHEEALDAYQQALDLYQQVSGTQKDQAKCLNGTGVTLGEMGRHEEALAAFRQALDLYQQVPGTQKDQAKCLFNTGITLGEMGRHEEALAAYGQALDLYQQAPGTQEDRADCLDSIAVTLRKVGRDKEAEDAERQAQELLQNL